MEDNQRVDTVDTLTDTGVDTQADKNETQVDVQNESDSGVNKSQEKLFTQEDVNRMIQERLDRVKKQNSNDNGNNLEAVVETLQNQLAQYEKEIAQSKYNINPEYLEFIDYKVSHSVDENKDYATALAEYMAGAGKTFIAEEKQEENKNTDPDVSKVNNVGSSNNGSSLADAIRKGAGL